MIAKKTALTLIEMIIATMLVSVVLMGLFSVSTVLSNNTQGYGQRLLLNSQTQATLDHILNDAALSVGSGTKVGGSGQQDQGIMIGPPAAPGNSFCIHQDPNSTPTNLNDDIWLCYVLELPPAGFAPFYSLYTCQKPYLPNDPNRGTTQLCVAPPGFGAWHFVGTAFSIAPQYNNSVFSITIQNCLNNSAASCQASGISTDQVNNPEITKIGSIACLQQGNS
ncbi:MAG: hypothetical protein HQL14_01445 [Candidatus Omnitrophica bacterium]|nr:hypothetical protein [Candidatus Omnitrophota bacterium]